MKKTLFIVIIGVALAVTMFFLLKNKNSNIKFKTEKVTKGDIVMSVTATGTVNAVTTVLVGTQVSGTIKNIFVDFNSPVKKGQIIAQIDPATFQAQVQQARANLLVAQANLEKAKATLTDAKRNMERNTELFSKNLVARSDLDTAETNYETAKESVSAASSQVAT